MKKINQYSVISTLCFIAIFGNSCKEDFLDRQPIGVFSEDALKTKAG
jgi:starch-binding outer membrane protein, SusD/RagB family